MTISQADVIDSITFPPGAPEKAHLVIIDHLAWSDLEAHLAALKNKLNTYLHVLVSGELHKYVTVPMSTTHAPTIVLVAVHEPPAEAQPLLERTSEVAASVGAEFRVVSLAGFEELVRETR